MSETGAFKQSFRASQSIGAFLVAAVSATTTAFNCELADTATSAPVGITQDAVSTGGSVQVVTLGRTLGICAASISAGALLSWETATGELVAVTNNTSTTLNKTIGIALQSGSSASAIEIFVNPYYASAGV